MTLYLTMFYTKRELGLRVGYLFVSAAIAGSVGGLLAYGKLNKTPRSRLMSTNALP